MKRRYLTCLGWLNLFEHSEADPISSRDPTGLAPDICGGTDCANPPYDLTPDGPGPSSSKPTKRDRGYKGWVDKCVDDLCDRINADTFTGWCQRQGCKWVTKWACKQVGRNFPCCDCVRHRCISSMDEKGMPEEVADVYCKSQFLRRGRAICTTRAARGVQGRRLGCWLLGRSQRRPHSTGSGLHATLHKLQLLGRHGRRRRRPKRARIFFINSL